MSEVLKNPRQVHRHLEEIGVKVSLRSVYNHVEAGRLKKGGDGCFSVASVKKYADALRSESNALPVDSAVVSDKQSAEIRKITAQAEVAEIKARQLRNELVDREWAERQLSSRALVIKSDHENFARSHAAAIVAKCDGKVEFIPDVVEYLLAEFEAMLGRYSEPVEFQIPSEPE